MRASVINETMPLQSCLDSRRQLEVFTELDVSSAVELNDPGRVRYPRKQKKVEKSLSELFCSLVTKDIIPEVPFFQNSDFG